MKKTVLLLVSLCALAATTRAQIDVTSQYLQNASFEQPLASSLTPDNTRGAATVGTGLTGWTVTGVYGVSDIMTAAATATDNNLGAPGAASDGAQMYYIRHAWTNGSASVKQTVTLPAAKYRLTVDSKSATPGTSSSGKLVAASENTVITMNSGSIFRRSFIISSSGTKASSILPSVGESTSLSVGSGSGVSPVMSKRRTLSSRKLAPAL